MSCKFKDLTKGNGIHPCCKVTNGECQFLNEPWDQHCDICNAYKNSMLGIRFTAVEAGSTIKFNVGAVTGNYEYSLNNKKFEDYTIGNAITLQNVNDFVEFRAKTTNADFCKNATDKDPLNPGITMTGKIAVAGNIQYLLDSSGNKMDVSSKCYHYMFFKNESLVSAHSLLLPAITLNSECYNLMFGGCKQLTTTPLLLPATTLAVNCYTSMFSSCSKIFQAPILKAKTLSKACCSWMFSACTSLTHIPKLPVTTLTESCYSNMFNGCTNLIQAPELPATVLAKNCYTNIFKNCNNITECHMKQSMETVYDKSIHGDTTKEVKFDLLD